MSNTPTRPEPTTHRTSVLRMGPGWLTGSNDTEEAPNEALLVWYALLLVLDAFEHAAEQSLLVHYPQQDPDGTPSPPNALAAIGRDRRVVRGLNESATSYAARLRKAHTDRQTTGNAFTLVQKIAEYVGDGIAKVRSVDRRGNWYTRDVDGTRSYVLATGNWNWDDVPASPRWARFWVIVYPGGVFGPPGKWGAPGAKWGDGRTWGSTATRDQIRTLQFLVSDWKAQGRRCVSIILAFDPDSFDPSSPEPDGTWGRWAKPDGTAPVRSRLSGAAYLKGS